MIRHLSLILLICITWMATLTLLALTAYTLFLTNP
jgi:hypothetical protein